MVGYSTPACSKLFKYGVKEIATTIYKQNKEIPIRIINKN